MRALKVMICGKMMTKILKDANVTTYFCVQDTHDDAFSIQWCIMLMLAQGFL